MRPWSERKCEEDAHQALRPCVRDQRRCCYCRVVYWGRQAALRSRPAREKWARGLVGVLLLAGPTKLGVSAGSKASPSSGPSPSKPSVPAAKLTAPCLHTGALDLLSEHGTYQRMVTATLANEARYGYNPATKGLWVNWQRSADGTLETNYNGSGHPDPPAGHNARHDPATDLRFLHNLLQWRADHPGSGAFASTIACYTAVVKAEFAGTDDLRGWYYGELRAIGQLSGDAWFTRTADNLVASYERRFDPRVGTIFEEDREHPSGFYRTDWALEEGSDLVVAGTRTHHPKWVVNGLSVLSFVRAHAYLPASGTYLHSMSDVLLPNGTVNPNETMATSSDTAGNGRTIDPSEVAQDAVALMEAGEAGRDAALVAEGEQLLGAFSPAVNTLKLWDTSSGGYYENGSFTGSTFSAPGSFEVSSGKKDPKELAMLQAFHYADKIERMRPFAGAEEAMLQVARRAYNPAQAGFPFELTAKWAQVRLYRCGCYEGWVTSEADGIAVEALQRWMG